MSPSSENLPEDYARGWSDLMRLVRRGYSWSGGERNRFFRNRGDGRFHEMSHLGGLDAVGDGRGLGVVDWDQDGRLDLWYRNRTAPRLQLMMNRRECGESVAIRLQGAAANRDGIGAVVELLPTPDGKRLVRSVRAGDLFLSQSSKWLHFGGSAGVTQAEVLWPGGARERFSGVSSGGRFLLQQGSGIAQPWSAGVRRVVSTLAPGEPVGVADDGGARIILPARIPMPAIAYRDALARPVAITPNGNPRLLVLWSGTCRQCRNELGALGDAEPRLRAAGLEVTALAVDGLDGPAADVSAAYDLVDALGFPFAWGLIDADSAGRIHRLQEALFDRTPADAVPIAFLLDGAGDAVAIYRGSLVVEELLQDWSAIRDADERQLYHLSPPLGGTWFTNPLGRRDLLRFVGSLMAAPQR
ncbi:MAG: ASPIC/UnbV domain-containing protein [Verrucomicrobiales bacterium]